MKTSKLRVTGLCDGNNQWPLNFPHKGPVTWKMSPFDDVIMSMGWCKKDVTPGHFSCTNLWWCHQMKLFPVLLALCAGNSPVTGEFPAQRQVTLSFDVFFDLRRNPKLSKQWRCWWFEIPSHSLWHHCNAIDVIHYWSYNRNKIKYNESVCVYHLFKINKSLYLLYAL